MQVIRLAVQLEAVLRCCLGYVLRHFLMHSLSGWTELILDSPMLDMLTCIELPLKS